MGRLGTRARTLREVVTRFVAHHLHTRTHSTSVDVVPSAQTLSRNGSECSSLPYLCDNVAIHHSHGFEAAHDVKARVRCATSVGRLYVRGQWQWAGLRVLSRVRGRGSGVLGQTYSARRRGGSACASPRGRRGRSQRRRGCGWPIAPARDDCTGSRGGHGYWPLCHRVCGRFGSTSRFVH